MCVRHQQPHRTSGCTKNSLAQLTLGRTFKARKVETNINKRFNILLGTCKPFSWTSLQIKQVQLQLQGLKISSKFLSKLINLLILYLAVLPHLHLVLRKLHRVSTLLCSSFLIQLFFLRHWHTQTHTQTHTFFKADVTARSGLQIPPPVPFSPSQHDPKHHRQPPSLHPPPSTPFF